MYFLTPTLPSSTTVTRDVCLSSLLTVSVHSEQDAALTSFFSHIQSNAKSYLTHTCLSLDWANIVLATDFIQILNESQDLDL